VLVASWGSGSGSARLGGSADETILQAKELSAVNCRGALALEPLLRPQAKEKQGCDLVGRLSECYVGRFLET
jgi:hypothetical protein